MNARPSQAFLPWVALALTAATLEARADDARDAVEWVAEPDAQCVQLGGTLTGVRNRDRQRTVRVWLDRWYLNLRTADRGRHDLPPDGSVRELGCSETRQGPQHWTLEDARFIDADAAGDRQP